MAKAKKDKEKKKNKYTSIGGQALMEGIMMRGPYKTVMCVRRADGSIVTETMETAAQTGWNKIPLLRGIVSFIQSMSLGTKLLMRSAEIAIEDEMAAEEAKAAEAKAVEEAEAVEETGPAEAVEAAQEAEAVEETEPAEAIEVTEEAEAVEETGPTEAAEEAAENAESAETDAAPSEPAEKAAGPAKPADVPSAELPKRSTGRKIVAILGSVLCLALGVYLFFFAAPVITDRVFADILPGIIPRRFAESFINYPDKWQLGTSIAVKAVMLVLLWLLASLFIGKTDKERAREEEKRRQKEQSGGDSGIMLAFSTILGFALAILLFSYVPTWVGSAMFKWVFPNVLPKDAAEHMALQSSQNIWRPIIEGVVKILILVGYMALISTMKEIRTLFSYHGAEHKTIACYEAGEELVVENVRKYRRFHPRCGTSFLILMLLVGIIVGMAAKYMLPADVANSNLWYPLIKIALIPIMMGIGYELLKFSGRHDNILTRMISAPGMWMQRITTKEPTDAMIECAIAAIKPVIPENGEDMM